MTDRRLSRSDAFRRALRVAIQRRRIASLETLEWIDSYTSYHACVTVVSTNRGDQWEAVMRRHFRPTFGMMDRHTQRSGLCHVTLHDGQSQLTLSLPAQRQQLSLSLRTTRALTRPPAYDAPMSPLRICSSRIRFLSASGRHRAGQDEGQSLMSSDGWIGQPPPCVQPHWVRGGVLDALIAPISPSTCSWRGPSLPLLSEA